MNRALSLLSMSCTLALAASSFGQQSTPAAPTSVAPKWKKVLPQTPPGIAMSEETIADYPEHKVTVVLYTPEKPGTYPAILDIHGGGWKDRQVEADKPMMERLATRGFVTAIVSYRVSGEAKYPAALHDAKAAVRYLRANAARLKIEPQHIGVMGGSAGGHLSGLLAMTSGLPEFDGPGGNADQSSAVQACVVMAGSQDLVAANKAKTGESAIAFFGTAAAENPELFAQASPITHVRPGVPPTIFIEGEKDSVKIGRAEMQEKLRALGIETALYTLKDAPHPFWMSEPWLSETVEIASFFFKKQLGEPNSAK